MQTKGCQDYYPDLPCGQASGDCSAAGCGCDGCGNNPELSYTEEEKEIAEEWATGGSEFGLAQRLAKYRMKLLGQAAERDALRDALEEIMRRGVVSDAKGSWSQAVHEIARAALAPKEDKQ